MEIPLIGALAFLAAYTGFNIWFTLRFRRAYLHRLRHEVPVSLFLALPIVAFLAIASPRDLSIRYDLIGIAVIGFTALAVLSGSAGVLGYLFAYPIAGPQAAQVTGSVLAAIAFSLIVIGIKQQRERRS